MSKSFDKLNNERTNLLIVDSLNLAFRWKHANKSIFASEFYSTVQSLAASYKAKDIIITGDYGSSFRKAIDTKYKANRQELRDKQTEEEAKEFQEFLKEVDRSINMFDTVFKFKGVEADDIAAYLCNKLKDEYEHIWLISTDKDWSLLVNNKVSQFSYRTRKETTINNWNEHFSFDPEDYISIKVLMGDKGDNVPGVEGVGEKRAYNILREFGPTAFDVYNNIPIDRPQKFIKNLNEFKEQILTNYYLMDLPTYCEEAIGKNNVETINNEIKNNL